MKTQVLASALLLAGLSITAQTEKKEATIRIKKVENVNGVETITDTTFTTTDPENFKWEDKEGNIKINEINGEDGKTMKVISIDEVGPDINEADVKEINAEIEKAMKEAGLDPNGKDMKKVIVINKSSDEKSGEKTEKHITRIVMVKMDVTDASPEDVKRLGAGNVDNKVEMDNMTLSPNPNNGKFNLNFKLKNKGDAEVTVYDMQGKQVYNEKLPNFTGEYNKPIDISENSKGIYFVKIAQGKHSQVKKIVLD